MKFCLKYIIDKFHFYVWKEITGYRPDRTDWYCLLRSRRGGEVQYKAFAIFGDKQWHDINDSSGCMPWEHPEIIKSARYHGLIK